ncbi:MAG: energy transducer TonB [Methylophaga sp.]|nr:energy transducer TonB [Methylophaga sp.]
MRLFVGLLLAIVVNVGLFLLMKQMVTPKVVDRQLTEDIRLLDFIRMQREETEPETRRRERPEPPPPPEEPPPPPPSAAAPDVTPPNVPSPQLNVPRIDVPLSIAGGPYLGDFMAAPAPAATPGPAIEPSMDDEVVPLVRIPPNYPRTAQRRGIEGVVTVEFTITRDGSVRDPVVVRATPENIFDREALNAIARWKFRPKVVDGQPVERRATQEIEFRMAR